MEEQTPELWLHVGLILTCPVSSVLCTFNAQPLHNLPSPSSPPPQQIDWNLPYDSQFEGFGDLK